jgi:hypothetical protein
MKKTSRSISRAATTKSLRELEALFVFGKKPIPQESRAAQHPQIIPALPFLLWLANLV